MAIMGDENGEGGLDTLVWSIRPLPKLLMNYMGVLVCYMIDMKNRWNRTNILLPATFLPIY